MSKKSEQRSALDISSGSPVDGDPIKMKAFIHDFHNNTVGVEMKIEIDPQQLHFSIQK